MRNFHDEEEKVDRSAGDEWLFVGPGFFVPHVAVERGQKIKAKVVKQNQAIKLRARQVPWYHCYHCYR